MPSKNEQVVMEGMTDSGGWTRARLTAWGVPWPPPKGWKRSLILQGFPYKPLPKFKIMDRNEFMPKHAEEMWADGAGTKEIADVLHVWEHDVYNWLAQRGGRDCRSHGSIGVTTGWSGLN